MLKARFAAALALLTAATGVTLAAGSPAQAAAPALQFTKIQYDSPGSDNRSNASLNAEYVRIMNKTTHNVSMTGWTVRDRSAHVYTFGTYTLGPGRSVYVHTGKGTNGRPAAADRYWGSGAYIWNNGGDAATLRDAANRTIDSCSWGTGAATTNC